MLVADVAFVSLVLMDRDLPLVLHVCGVWCVRVWVGGAGLRAATVGNNYSVKNTP